DSLPGIVYFYDQEFRFLRWNKNFQVVSGYSDQEISQMHPLDFFSGEEKETVRRKIDEVFEKGEAFVEASFVCKKGKKTPHLFTGRSVLSHVNNCLGGIGIDISAQTQMQVALAASEARYRSTIENVIEGCQLLDFDWCYLFLNPAAELQSRRP